MLQCKFQADVCAHVMGSSIQGAFFKLASAVADFFDD